MLRLLPSEITLTNSELYDFHMRAELRDRMRLAETELEASHMSRGSFSETISSGDSPGDTEEDETCEYAEANTQSPFASRRDSAISFETINECDVRDVCVMSRPSFDNASELDATLDGSSSAIMPSLASSQKFPSLVELNVMRRYHSRSQSEPLNSALPDRHEGWGKVSGRNSLQQNVQEGALITLDDDEEQKETKTPNIRRVPVPTHARRVSLPPVLEQTVLAFDELVQRQPLDTPPARSAMREAMKNSASPLDELIEEASAILAAPWIAQLSIRPAPCDIATLDMRWPDFGGVSDEDVNEEHSRTTNQPQRQETLRSRRRALRVPRYPVVMPQTTPSLHLPTGVEAMLLSGTLGRSMPTEFALPSARLNQPSNRPRTAIRRRPLPNAEQENEDETNRYLDERQAHLARQVWGRGGVLERTPTPEGRLERFLR